MTTDQLSSEVFRPNPIYSAILYLVFLLIIPSVASAAEDDALTFRSEREAVSLLGFSETRVHWSISESDSRRYWITINTECSAPERIVIAEADKSDGSYVITASRLTAGENTIRLCVESSKGRISSTATLIIAQDDKAPTVTLEPLPGDYDSPPEVRLNGSGKIAGILYTVDGSEPRFATGNLPQNGQLSGDKITLNQNDITIKAKALSAAGIVSPAVSGRYRVDRRLTGWHERTILVGYENVQTLGSVQSYLPSANGLSLGFRLGLDNWLNPASTGFAARRIWMPGLLTQGRYLYYSQGGYGETIIGLVAGPEWVFPLSLKRSLFLLAGAAPGLAYLSVSTPSKINTGVAFSAQAHAGIEWQLGATGFFAHLKYVWFADEVAPLQGWGGSAGMLIRL